MLSVNLANPANQSVVASSDASVFPSASASGDNAQRETLYAQYKIIRRNGAVVGFEPPKIAIAMTKAFIAVNGGQGAASARVREQVVQLTDNVVNALMRRQPSGGTFHIEDIQDQVELALMRGGEHHTARAYVLYREERAKERASQRATQQAAATDASTVQPGINVTENGVVRPLTWCTSARW